MAIMYIQEYAELATDANGHTIQAGKEPALASQFVTYSTSTASAAFNKGTRFVRINCDGAAFLSFGLSPTATTSEDMPVQANTPEFFGVIPQQKVAAVS